MGLAPAVEGSNHTPQQITWAYENGNPVLLTGATLSAKKRQSGSDVVTDVTGNLNIVDPDLGTFTWTYSAADVAKRGLYVVQFIATYADTTIEKSYTEEWEVKDALDVVA